MCAIEIEWCVSGSCVFLRALRGQTCLRSRTALLSGCCLISCVLCIPASEQTVMFTSLVDGSNCVSWTEGVNGGSVYARTRTTVRKRAVLSGGINLLCLNFAQRKILALTLWRERWTGALHAKFEVNWARRWDYLTDVMWRAEWMSPMETRHAWRSQHPKRFGINALILDVLETLTDEIQHLSTARDILQIIQRQYPRTPWMRCQIIGYCFHSMYK